MYIYNKLIVRRCRLKRLLNDLMVNSAGNAKTGRSLRQWGSTGRCCLLVACFWVKGTTSFSEHLVLPTAANTLYCCQPSTGDPTPISVSHVCLSLSITVCVSNPPWSLSVCLYLKAVSISVSLYILLSFLFPSLCLWHSLPRTPSLSLSFLFIALCGFHSLSLCMCLSITLSIPLSILRSLLLGARGLPLSLHVTLCCAGLHKDVLMLCYLLFSFVCVCLCAHKPAITFLSEESGGVGVS